MKDHKMVFAFTEEDKNSGLYKFANRFLNDHQKESILLNLLINGFWIVYHAPFLTLVLKKDALDGGRMFKVANKTHICFCSTNTEGRIQDFMFKKRGFLSKWKEVNPLPEEIANTLDVKMGRKEFGKAVGTALKMVAFW